jgi:tRNA threonylcarbamoyladenosine biosynthesis protein TsaE
VTTAPRHVPTTSEAETFALGIELARDLHPSDIVLLRGELGMGKTVLARGLSSGLGVPEDEIRSPTFTLVNIYQGRFPVYHIDLYRIEKPKDLDELGLEEILGGDGISIVEWPDRLGPYHPDRALTITLTDRGGTSRDIEVLDARSRRK